MSILSDILARVTGKGADGHPGQDDLQVRELRAKEALTNLYNERVAIRQTIAAAIQRRKLLLLQDGSDAEITKADREIDRGHLLLERFDEIEPILQDQSRAARMDRRRADLKAFGNLYLAHAEAFIQAIQVAGEMRDRMVDARKAAAHNGFESESYAFDIPDNRFSMDISHGRRFLTGVRQQVESVQAKQEHDIYVIRMLKRTGIYRANEEIGVSAEIGWMYVDAGVGVWRDNATIPKRPAPDMIVPGYDTHSGDLSEMAGQTS